MKILIFIKDIPPKKYGRGFDREALKIMAEIYKMKPYISVLHTGASNVIEIDVRWKSSKIFPNLRKLQSLPGVSGFLTFHEPLAELEKAAVEHDYVKAYSLGATFFESVGINILKKYHEINNIPIGTDAFHNISLHAIIVMLYSHGLITLRIYNALTKLNKIRNRHVIHSDITKKPDFATLEEIIEPMDKISICARELEKKYVKISQG